MSYLISNIATVTTTGATTGSATLGTFTGYVEYIQRIPGTTDLSSTGAVLVSTTGGRGILSITNTTGGWTYYPRVQSHTTAGATITLSTGAAAYKLYDRIPLKREKVVVTSYSTAAGSCTFELVVSGVSEGSS